MDEPLSANPSSAKEVCTLHPNVVGLCHDIRGLLHIMRVQAQMMIWADKQMSPDVVAFSRSIITNVERVNSILDAFTHQGPPPLQDLSKLANATLLTLRPLAQSKRMLLLDNIDTRPLPIALYPGDVHRILQNLVNNALEACAPDTGKVVVTAALVDASEGPRVRLTVSDNGSGIDENTMKRVGQFGFTTKPDGSGYGLYIVQSMVERRGGVMTLRSQAGQGTTITIDFPVAQEPITA